MKQSKDLVSEVQKYGMAAIPGPLNIDGDGSFDLAGAGAHDEDSIAHVDSFIDIMSDQEHGGETSQPKS